MITRRHLLARGAAAVAGAAVPGAILQAMTGVRRFPNAGIPLTPTTRRLCPAAWIPDLPVAESFHALASAAMDAAAHAGLEFADIRLAVERSYRLDRFITPALTFGYTVRARVNGTWSVKHGTLMTTDAVVAAMQGAASTAHTTAAVNAQIRHTDAPPLAPAPVVTGEWRSPCEIDPFLVPLDDSLRLLATWRIPAGRFGHVGLNGSLEWRVRTTVFASTTGSRVTQTTMRAFPSAAAATWLPSGPSDVVTVNAAGLEPISAGYEAVLAPDIPDRLAVAAETAIRLRQLPKVGFSDVGRYPVVFSGSAFASLVGQTLNGALDGDRIAGLEADAAGRSFLAPPSMISGAPAPAFSPLLTITSHRTAPSVAAVQWDDDGVVPDAYTLIDRGHVVDYHTTRETAPVLAEWYHQRGLPMRSHGCAITATPASAPTGGTGHLRVAPGATPANLDDLIREMRHGFLLRSGDADASPNLSLASFRSVTALEIRNGKPVHRVPDLWLSLASKTIFNAQLTALGDATTLDTQMAFTQKGMPWERLSQPVTTPAAQCKDVDVVLPYQDR